MRPFVGVGPGRCGTETLVRFVRACGYKVTHEAHNSRWYSQEEKQIVDLAKKLNSGMLHGEVNCRLFPDLRYLKRKVNHLGIVCLHRMKDEVVRSYMKNIKPMFRPVDRMAHPTQTWPQRYPVIDAATAKQSVEFWWEMCEEFMYSDSSECVFHMKAEYFNADFRVKELHEFLEIPEAKRVIPEQRIYNTTEERAAMTDDDHKDKIKEMTCV